MFRIVKVSVVTFINDFLHTAGRTLSRGGTEIQWVELLWRKIGYRGLPRQPLFSYSMYASSDHNGNSFSRPWMPMPPSSFSYWEFVGMQRFYSDIIRHCPKFDSHFFPILLPWNVFSWINSLIGTSSVSHTAHTLMVHNNSNNMKRQQYSV